MGTYVSCIFWGYFTHILRAQNLHFSKFWGPKDLDPPVGCQISAARSLFWWCFGAQILEILEDSGIICIC